MCLFLGGWVLCVWMSGWVLGRRSAWRLPTLPHFLPPPPPSPHPQDEVTCVGQAIGVVAADTEAAAAEAAKAVVVEYEDLPALMDCEDAIAGGWVVCTWVGCW